MAQCRIRRWLQFGVLDLLILMAIASVIAALSRGVQPQLVEVRPWVAGHWASYELSLLLSPNGGWSDGDGEGTWTIERGSGPSDAFVVECGKHRFVVRKEEHVLLIDEKPGNTLDRPWRFEGPLSRGKPQGRWSLVGGGVSAFRTLAYRNGELVDFHDYEGHRDMRMLNAMRGRCGLSALGKHDFPMRAHPKETSDE